MESTMFQERPRRSKLNTGFKKSLIHLSQVSWPLQIFLQGLAGEVKQGIFSWVQSASSPLDVAKSNTLDIHGDIIHFVCMNQSSKYTEQLCFGGCYCLISENKIVRFKHLRLSKTLQATIFQGSFIFFKKAFIKFCFPINPEFLPHDN